MNMTDHPGGGGQGEWPEWEENLLRDHRIHKLDCLFPPLISYCYEIFLVTLPPCQGAGLVGPLA